MSRAWIWVLVAGATVGCNKKDDAGKENKPPPPATGWWESRRAAITTKWNQINVVASQRWKSAVVTEPLKCIRYQPDTLGEKVAALYNADILGEIHAFPLTSKSGGDDKETACLSFAKGIAENAPFAFIASEAEQRACLAWLDKLDTIVVVNKDDEVSGEAVAVELASRRVRYRAPVNSEAMLAGRTVTGQGSGATETEAKAAAAKEADRIAGMARDSAFQSMALSVFRCR